MKLQVRGPGLAPKTRLAFAGVGLGLFSFGLQAHAQGATDERSGAPATETPPAGQAAFPEEAAGQPAAASAAGAGAPGGPSQPTKAQAAPAAAPQESPSTLVAAPPAGDSSVVAGESEAAPPEPEEPALPTQREPGFYLHLSGGLAYNWARTNEGATTSRIKYDGWSTNLFASAGYMLAPGFAVHGDLYSLFSFDVNIDDPGNGAPVTSDGAALSVVSLGGGLTYHFMPIDIFLTASAGVARGSATEWAVVADENGNEATAQRVASTEPGFAFHAAAGKMFYITPKWALGGGIHYNYATFSPSSDQNADTLALERIHSVWLAFETTFQP